MSKETTMTKPGDERPGDTPVGAEGARRATEAATGGATTGPLGPGQRWSVARKREVTLRLLRGESLEALSRELGVELYRLEAWRDRAHAGIDASLRVRTGDPVQVELDHAMKRIGELSMENELLRERCRSKFPLASGRSRR
jgi:transposase-like protein